MDAEANFLPDSARVMAELIGYAPTLALCKVLGGADLRFGGPMAPTIITIIGADAYAVLLKHYGHERVSIPRCHQLLRRQLIHNTMMAIDAGATGTQAALAAGVTRRTVCNWRKEAKAADPSPQDHPDLWEE